MKLDRFINRPVDRIEFRDCSVGGTNQRCRKHDVYDLNCVKHGFR